MSEKIDPKNLIMLHEMAIYNCMNKLIREINLYGSKPDMIIGIQRGGLIPAVHLSHYYDVPLQTMTVSFRDQSNVVGFDVIAKVDPNIKTLIIDDINDSGSTIGIIKDLGNNLTTKIHFAVLINKSESKSKVEYYGKTVNSKINDPWYVFPWENWWKLNEK